VKRFERKCCGEIPAFTLNMDAGELRMEMRSAVDDEFSQRSNKWILEN